MNGLSAYIVTQLGKELETLPSRKNEITQHLVELGYIALHKANALMVKDVKEAQEKFMDEVQSSGLFTEAQIKILSVRGHEYMIGTLLRRLTDIDEGITLDKLPVRGETGLISRMIHYRIDLFGLWPLENGAPFSNVSLEKLDEIAGFAKSTRLEAVNHLADMEQFTKHLLQNHPPESFVLVFRSPKVKSEIKKKLDRRQAFKRQLIEDFGDRTDYIRNMARDVLKNNPDKVDFNFLQRAANDPFKRFVIRLLQIHQWQDGFYNGLLDSDMGTLTLDSFVQTIDFYNQTDGRHIKTHKAITYVHQGYFVFNSLFFLQEYMIEEETPGSGDAILQSITNQLQTAGEDERRDFNNNLHKLKKDIYNDSEKQPKERKGFLQRIYYGIKRFIKKAFRFIKKIYTWIKDRVEKVWGILKGLFRNFFENLQLGIRAFVDGIKFIFGRKEIESQTPGETILSKFSIDGDSVSISTEQISEVLEEHLRKIGYNIDSMKFTLAIVAGILKLVIGMVSIITWPLLLINIIKIYKNIAEAFDNMAAKAA